LLVLSGAVSTSVNITSYGGTHIQLVRYCHDTTEIADAGTENYRNFFTLQ